MDTVTQRLNFDESDFDEELNISCRTNSSGCDVDDALDTSEDSLSPHNTVFDQSMDFTNCDSPTNNHDKTPAIFITGPTGHRVGNNHRESGPQSRLSTDNSVTSPPYKRVRALRLFDAPATPKTIMEKSSMHTPVPVKNTRSYITDKARPVASSYQIKSDKPAANVNPFTPNGMMLTARKRSRSKRTMKRSPSGLCIPKFDLADTDSDNEMEQPTKRVALQESNIPRYYQEFHEVGLIGTGEFGSVYKCINRLDGCVYAIKKSLKPIAGSVNEKNALNEVYAHAVLGSHKHVVRYYSAWAEDNHMIIQNEYCNGGSLAELINNMREEGRSFTVYELQKLTSQLADGLNYIHNMQLVHMDIKPGNIFISKERRYISTNYDSADDGFDEEETIDVDTTYKFGDLGHVTSMNNPQVEEGDCRYLPSEILREDFTNLSKADVFALGLTIYEAAGGGPLPKNGPEWHEIRNNGPQPLPKISSHFNQLLKSMIHPNPMSRPSATQILAHRALCQDETPKSKAQLERDVATLKSKNDLLSKRLEDALRRLSRYNGREVSPVNSHQSGYSLRHTPTRTSGRKTGKNVNRSFSSTTF